MSQPLTAVPWGFYRTISGKVLRVPGMWRRYVFTLTGTWSYGLVTRRFVNAPRRYQPLDHPNADA